MNLTVFVEKRLLRQLRLVQVMWLFSAALMLLLGTLEVLRMLSILPPSTRVKMQVSSSMILIISAVGLFFTLYQAWAEGKLIARMQKVYLTVSEAGVSGVSLINPARPDKNLPEGEAFQTALPQMKSVCLRQQFFFPRFSSIRIEIQTAHTAYSVPGIERAHEVCQWLNDQLQTVQDGR